MDTFADTNLAKNTLTFLHLFQEITTQLPLTYFHFYVLQFTVILSAHKYTTGLRNVELFIKSTG